MPLALSSLFSGNNHPVLLNPNETERNIESIVMEMAVT